MELKPHNIYVTVSYPPDTDTPGYKEEMLSTPSLTKLISESGVVFSPESVAKDIVSDSTMGYFGSCNGVDGWLLKQAHGGMTPINNAMEVYQQVLVASLARFVSIAYILYWDYLVYSYTHAQPSQTSDDGEDKKDKKDKEAKKKAKVKGN